MNIETKIILVRIGAFIALMLLFRFSYWLDFQYVPKGAKHPMYPLNKP